MNGSIAMTIFHKKSLLVSGKALFNIVLTIPFPPSWIDHDGNDWGNDNSAVVHNCFKAKHNFWIKKISGPNNCITFTHLPIDTFAHKADSTVKPTINT